jgi:hypothetical protein
MVGSPGARKLVLLGLFLLVRAAGCGGDDNGRL